jgi:hypothetical protein
MSEAVSGLAQRLERFSDHDRLCAAGPLWTDIEREIGMGRG